MLATLNPKRSGLGVDGFNFWGFGIWGFVGVGGCELKPGCMLGMAVGDSLGPIAPRFFRELQA